MFLLLHRRVPAAYIFLRGLRLIKIFIFFRQLLPGRLDWLGNEHPRTYEDVVRFNELSCSVSVVIVLWQRGGPRPCSVLVYGLCSCILLGNCRGFFRFGGFKSQIRAPLLISDGELRFGGSEIVICSDGLTIFSPDYSTADRVGRTAPRYVELPALANQRPNCAVSASFCVWPGIWLVP